MLDCLRAQLSRAQLFKGLIVYRPNCEGPDCAGSDSVGPGCAGPDRTCTMYWTWVETKTCSWTATDPELKPEHLLKPSPRKAINACPKIEALVLNEEEPRPLTKSSGKICIKKLCLEPNSKHALKLDIWQCIETFCNWTEDLYETKILKGRSETQVI
jgi:hypothetical protein